MKTKQIILTLLHLILHNQRTIMTQQDDAAAALNKVADQLDKVQTEIKALQDAVAAEPAGTVSPALQAAIDRVTVAAQQADDMNPDAAPETPPTV